MVALGLGPSEVMVQGAFDCAVMLLRIVLMLDIHPEYKTGRETARSELIAAERQPGDGCRVLSRRELGEICPPELVVWCAGASHIVLWQSQGRAGGRRHPSSWGMQPGGEPMGEERGAGSMWGS